MAKVFLSHSTIDKPLARRLATDLRNAGHFAWLDEVEIHVGHSITKKVQEGLEQADFIAVLLTRHSVASGWVEREWQSRIDREIKNRSVEILPIKADRCEVPLLLRDKKYADLSDYEAGIASLLRALDHHQRRSDSPQRPPSQKNKSSVTFAAARQEMDQRFRRRSLGIKILIAVPALLLLGPGLLSTCRGSLPESPRTTIESAASITKQTPQPTVTTPRPAKPKLSEPVAKSARKLVSSGWTRAVICSPMGCSINRRIVCKVGARYLRLGRTEQAQEFSYDLEQCTPTDPAQTDACFSAPDEIFPLQRGAPIFATLEFADGSRESFKVETTMEQQSFRDDSASWTQLEPVSSNPAATPVALARLRLAGDPYEIYLGAGGCGQVHRIAAMLYDIDGRGLVESKKGQYSYDDSRPTVFRLPNTPSASEISIALDKTSGTRLGPFVYRFDATKIIRAGAKDVGAPRLRCMRLEQRRQPFWRCSAPGEVSTLAWLDVREIRYGDNEQSLDSTLRIDITEQFAVDVGVNARGIASRIAYFDLPIDWKDVYYRLLLANDELSPTIRVPLQES